MAATRPAHGGTRANGVVDLSVPGTPNVLRRLNRIQVLRVIRERGSLSRPEIASLTGLSKVTVSEVVADLLRADLVREKPLTDENDRKRPGRRPRQLSFRAEVCHVVGVDIGAEAALVVVADASGRRLGEHPVATGAAGSREELLRIVRRAFGDALHATGLRPDDVAAVAIGTPGVVSPDTGRVTLAPQLPDWEGICLADELSLDVSCPVVVANEVQLAVLGEQWRGAAVGVDQVVYLHIGVGVGLGMVIGGQLHRGASGAAGEIGYLPLGVPDDPERPPDIGRFEWLIGGPAYERAAHVRLDDRKLAALRERSASGRVDAECIFTAAQEGDAEAASIIDDILELTALGLSGILAILDPEAVIVGGGVSRAGSTLLEPLAEKVRALVSSTARFAVSALGKEAVATGALRMALETWEAEVFSLGSTDSQGRLA